MITGLMKVILYVENMNQQVRFYRDVIGLPILFPTDLADYSDQYWVEFDAGGCSLVMHGGGQKRLGADTPKLAFGVDGIEATREQLIQQGVTMGEVRSPAPNVYVADGIDPEGNPFSIDEHR